MLYNIFLMLFIAFYYSLLQSADNNFAQRMGKITECRGWSIPVPNDAPPGRSFAAIWDHIEKQAYVVCDPTLDLRVQLQEQTTRAAQQWPAVKKSVMWWGICSIGWGVAVWKLLDSYWRIMGIGVGMSILGKLMYEDGSEQLVSDYIGVLRATHGTAQKIAQTAASVAALSAYQQIPHSCVQAFKQECSDLPDEAELCLIKIKGFPVCSHSFMKKGYACYEQEKAITRAIDASEKLLSAIETAGDELPLQSELLKTLSQPVYRGLTSFPVYQSSSFLNGGLASNLPVELVRIYDAYKESVMRIMKEGTRAEAASIDRFSTNSLIAYLAKWLPIISAIPKDYGCLNDTQCLPLREAVFAAAYPVWKEKWQQFVESSKTAFTAPQVGNKELLRKRYNKCKTALQENRVYWEEELRKNWAAYITSSYPHWQYAQEQEIVFRSVVDDAFIEVQSCLERQDPDRPFLARLKDKCHNNTASNASQREQKKESAELVKFNHLLKKYLPNEAGALKLKANYTPQELRAAYQAAAKVISPDKCGGGKLIELRSQKEKLISALPTEGDAQNQRECAQLQLKVQSVCKEIEKFEGPFCFLQELHESLKKQLSTS